MVIKEVDDLMWGENISASGPGIGSDFGCARGNDNLLYTEEGKREKECSRSRSEEGGSLVGGTSCHPQHLFVAALYITNLTHVHRVIKGSFSKYCLLQHKGQDMLACGREMTGMQESAIAPCPHSRVQTCMYVAVYTC